MTVALTRGAFVILPLLLSSPSVLVDQGKALVPTRATTQSVRQRVRVMVQEDPPLAGQLLRLAFHDATTWDEGRGGANGSIQFELDRGDNRGLGVPLLAAQRVREAVGPGAVSLADVVALAGAEAVEASGGPAIRIRVGRRDAVRADEAKLRAALGLSGPTRRGVVRNTLPEAGLDSDGLRRYFRRLGLSDAEWVALCGAHDLGRHVTLLGMSRECLRDLTRECLEAAPVKVPFVAEAPDGFSNAYYGALLRWNAREIRRGDANFIPTDVALVVDGGLRPYVERFAADERLFFDAFARGYRKLVDRTAASAAATF